MSGNIAIGNVELSTRPLRFWISRPPSPNATREQAEEEDAGDDERGAAAMAGGPPGVAAADHRDQEDVDRGLEERIEDRPELAEQAVRVRTLELGLRQGAG